MPAGRRALLRRATRSSAGTAQEQCYAAGGAVLVPLEPALPNKVIFCPDAETLPRPPPRLPFDIPWLVMMSFVITGSQKAQKEPLPFVQFSMEP